MLLILVLDYTRYHRLKLLDFQVFVVLNDFIYGMQKEYFTILELKWKKFKIAIF